MKILFLVHHFPPNFTGGAEWRTYRTAQMLIQRGMEVVVVCVESVSDNTVPGIRSVATDYQGVPVIRLFYNRNLSPDPIRLEFDNHWIGDFLDQFLVDQEPDLIHLVSGYLMSGRSIRVGKAHHIPVVLSLTDFWFLCHKINMLSAKGIPCDYPAASYRCARCQGEEKRRYRLPAAIIPEVMEVYWRIQTQKIRQIEERNHFLTETLQMVDLIISPSNFLRNIFLKSGISEKSIVFCRQGRDFPGLSPDKFTKKKSSHLRVGYIGQIVYHKGVHLLCDAMKMIPSQSIELLIYGDMTKHPVYAKKILEYAGKDSRIRIQGSFQRTDELWRIFQELDLVVVPSLWYENSPNVIIEAFAHHTPVITARSGGMAEMVREGVDGLLFTSGDASSLANCLKSVLDDPVILPSLASHILPIKSAAEEIDELVAIYESVLQEQKACS